MIIAYEISNPFERACLEHKERESRGMAEVAECVHFLKCLIRHLVSWCVAFS